jgi:hypothetical protein
VLPVAVFFDKVSKAGRDAWAAACGRLGSGILRRWRGGVRVGGPGLGCCSSGAGRCREGSARAGVPGGVRAGRL